MAQGNAADHPSLSLSLRFLMVPETNAVIRLTHYYMVEEERRILWWRTKVASRARSFCGGGECGVISEVKSCLPVFRWPCDSPFLPSLETSSPLPNRWIDGWIECLLNWGRPEWWPTTTFAFVAPIVSDCREGDGRFDRRGRGSAAFSLKSISHGSIFVVSCDDDGGSLRVPQVRAWKQAPLRRPSVLLAP